jgi:hypothetical protein
VESEPSPAESDGAGRYQDNLTVVCLESCDGTHNGFDAFRGKFALRACDRASSQLNDYAFCAAQKAISPLIALKYGFAHLMSPELTRVRHWLQLSNSNCSHDVEGADRRD